jgi:hypothetical protein
METALTLGVLKGRFSINRLDPSSEIPKHVQKQQFVCIARTSEELSIVASEEITIDAEKIDSGWRCFFVKGPLAFELIGILAGISRVLADAKISIFAISTYDTDYILVKDSVFEQACSALSNAGYTIDAR